MATALHAPDERLRSVQLAILAKASIPGLAKKQTTVAWALAARLGPVMIWCAPDSRHRIFGALKRTIGIDLLVQSSGDLGDRMHTALRLHCTQGPLLVVGTDCPVLRPEHLRDAAQALMAGDDAVFCPAEDGALVDLPEQLERLDALLTKAAR